MVVIDLLFSLFFSTKSAVGNMDVNHLFDNLVKRKDIE